MFLFLQEKARQEQFLKDLAFLKEASAHPVYIKESYSQYKTAEETDKTYRNPFFFSSCPAKKMS